MVLGLDIIDIPDKLLQLQQNIFDLRTQNKIELQNGDIGFGSAPSNIALIKYWGKHPSRRQIPLNSSLSFTLQGFRSKTSVTVLGRFFPGTAPENALYKNRLSLHGPNFSSEQIPEKMDKFVRLILTPFAPEIALHIHSHNSFPTACGIASSASGYAALVAAVSDLLQLNKYFTPAELQYWQAEWARIGSGSATRSAFSAQDALFVEWECPENLEIGYPATHFVSAHEEWDKLKHCILLLDESEKEIPSSAGHLVVESSPFQALRRAGIAKKMYLLKKALAAFDFATVQSITEEDAFAMHTIMQTSEPPARYLTKGVSEFISIFVQMRDKENAQAFWTLDAGPNIHLLFLESAQEFINKYFAACKKIKPNLKVLVNTKISE